MLAAATHRHLAPARKAGRWEFSLYVAGATPQAVFALRNLEDFCQKRLGGNCSIKVIDVHKHPKRARADQIVAIPTLVRNWPQPVRVVIGNLSKSENLIKGLGLTVPTGDGE